MEKTKKNFMIIDGSSLVHRAFYALPLLNTKDGLYTNGVFGFLNMLYRVQEDYDLDYICVAFDRSEPTFRHKEYQDYKGHRDKTPSELSIQFPLVKEILQAMKIKQLDKAGYEADDIAGTLARLGEENGLNVILLTGDKDYLQLTSDKTKVLFTKKGISELEEYNLDKIREEYGIEPKQFIDLKGLVGDKSDNIPGVPGIGEKTGLKFIKEYGSMESLYDNIDKISGKKTKENLIENKSLAFLSRQLGEIFRNVPLDESLEDFKIMEPDLDKLRDLFEKLEFKTLLEKLPGNESLGVDMEFDYSLIKLEETEEIIGGIRKNSSLGFRFLTVDDNYINSDIIGFAFKIDDGKTYYIDLEDKELKKFAELIKGIFESKDIVKYGHHIKADIFNLLNLGIEIENFDFDTMIGQYLINPAQNDYSINEIGKEYINYTGIREESLLGKGKNKRNFKDIDVDERGQYLAQYLDICFNSRDKMKKSIEEMNMMDLYYRVELPLTKVLANMEFHGFKVDVEVLKELSKEYEHEIDKLTKDIYEYAGQEFNINSPKQLGEILFDKLKLPVIKKTKTGYSTDVEVLEKLQGQHEIIDSIFKFRQIVKLKSTYIDGLLNVVDKDTHKIHSTFNQTITNTGRISSKDPNLQNIPVKTEEGRQIRKAFIANEDFILIDGDYSQIELRVLAHISDDPKMKKAFESGEDIHTQTASEVFHVPKEKVDPSMRDRAKAVNFGIVYGISDYGLSRDLNISRKEAKTYIDNYLKNYDKVHRFMGNIVEEGKDKGYVETIMHRRRYVPELKSRNFNIRSFGERIAMNTPIQGSAADIIKVAMVNVFNEIKKRKLKSRLILQVHDELIIETYKGEEEEVKDIMKDIMESAIDLSVPLKVDISMGNNWYDTK